MQEVGCNQAQSLGCSTDGFATSPIMRKLHLIWATTGLHIEMYKYPAWSDGIEIETWLPAEGTIRTRRDFIIKDYATEEVVGRATRLAFPEKNNKSLKRIPKLEDYRPGLVPRRGDLDMNQHVNNVAYIGWVLESMPQEVINTHELRSLTLDYRRECQHADIVDSLTTAVLDEGMEMISVVNGTNTLRTISQDDSDSRKFLHLLRLSGNNAEISRGRTEWRKKPLG